MTRFVSVSAAAPLIVTAIVGVTAPVRARQVTAPGTITAAQPCSNLSSLRPENLPNRTTRITTAALRPAAAAQPASNPIAGPTPALPEHCEVVASINDRVGATGQRFAINFRLRLPATWNGRFFFQGGGGTNGTVGDALGNLQGQQPTVALALGYAVVSQDSGHDNAANGDPENGGTQAFGFDPQARRDFGYNSYDEVTRAAKSLIRLHYGRAPVKSYFVGCSEGGREGMMVSQRFPEHFDGILACAPGLHLPQAALAALSDSRAFAAVARQAGLVDPNGLPLLNKTFTDQDLLLVSNAVLSACDRLDPLADGLVQNFEACTSSLVEPRLTAITCSADKTPECLSPAQIAALRTVFAGTMTPDGRRVYPARAWDAGIGGRAGVAYNQGWRIWKVGGYTSDVNTGLDVTLSSTAFASIFATPPVPVATTGGDQVAFALSVDADQAARALEHREGPYTESALEFMKADSTDLSAFRKRGGKMLIVHGVSDPVFSIGDTVEWWKQLDTVERGRAAEFVRLFAVPGMNHCAGGPSTDQFNAFAALVDWVENGTAPERIIATARETTPWPGRTRPLCVYPSIAAYTGRGSMEDAANFVCTSTP